MRMLQQAAETMPPELRTCYLERVMAMLAGEDFNDRLVHNVAYEVGRQLIWETRPSPP
jgi:hypothetical protein